MKVGWIFVCALLGLTSAVKLSFTPIEFKIEFRQCHPDSVYLVDIHEGYMMTVCRAKHIHFMKQMLNRYHTFRGYHIDIDLWRHFKERIDYYQSLLPTNETISY